MIRGTLHPDGSSLKVAVINIKVSCQKDHVRSICSVDHDEISHLLSLFCEHCRGPVHRRLSVSPASAQGMSPAHKECLLIKPRTPSFRVLFCADFKYIGEGGTVAQCKVTANGKAYFYKPSLSRCYTCEACTTSCTAAVCGCVTRSKTGFTLYAASAGASLGC